MRPNRKKCLNGWEEGREEEGGRGARQALKCQNEPRVSCLRSLLKCRLLLRVLPSSSASHLSLRASGRSRISEASLGWKGPTCFSKPQHEELFNSWWRERQPKTRVQESLFFLLALSPTQSAFLLSLIFVCGIVVFICVCSCWLAPNGPNATILEY